MERSIDASFQNYGMSKFQWTRIFLGYTSRNWVNVSKRGSGLRISGFFFQEVDPPKSNLIQGDLAFSVLKGDSTLLIFCMKVCLGTICSTDRLERERSSPQKFAASTSQLNRFLFFIGFICEKEMTSTNFRWNSKFLNAIVIAKCKKGEMDLQSFWIPHCSKIKIEEQSKKSIASPGHETRTRTLLRKFSVCSEKIPSMFWENSQYVLRKFSDQLA